MQKRWQSDIIPLCELEIFKPSVKLGIDINEKHVDIKKIFLKKYSQVVLNSGNDPEDVLQEVYKTILIKNKGKCPFDPRKSAFSTYVMMIIHNVVSNYLTKSGKYTTRKKTIEDYKYNKSDTDRSAKDYDEDLFIHQIREMFKDELREIFDYLMQGMNLSFICKKMSISNKELKKRIHKIQKQIKPELRLGLSC